MDAKIQKLIPVIQASSLFSGFSPKELSSLFETGTYSISNYPKNNIIHFESEKCQTLDIILDGEIIIQRIDENGNALTIVDFRPGDSLGGNLLFSRNPFYPMTVISKTDATILQIKKELVLKLCQSDMNFLLEFLSCISDKTTILTNKIKTISLKSIRSSVIDFLRYEYFLQKNTRIMLGMSKKELAERMGIQRTSLSRELGKMRAEGLIEFDSHSITILDLDIIR
ncbi:transcriptional regulator, Crp/Fnr family (plasmid) [Peptoclostridium acidaminophilum DSM 3953]|uniref:Transcriptional regulator, Crp/Fnr family n=1 Tax=Peptoclostridium acidaminophilum DSM 3953 TaxID=1286171 RepID=W8TQ58_PEPAC|nr:Crp/Fnr family transcriptional regulator [Peptoclostridium acidaminophilum]AHM58227.1 transcriptional regulator, Crp/Fnr family [Peptoclostridium acidaminophilum DSM 3953]